jgi:hypothetical protein
MRRLGMMVVALMMVATMSFAQKVSDSKSMSFDKLSRYLQLDANQIAEVSEINTYFENQLGQPLSCNNARPEETRNALLCNLKLMKRALTKDQYRKYVALINVTRANQEDKVSNPLLDSYLAEK